MTEVNITEATIAQARNVNLDMRLIISYSPHAVRLSFTSSLDSSLIAHE
jgi:hypothetical protein